MICPTTEGSGMLVPNELAELQEQFQEFHIWREVTRERVRYVARSHHLGLHPHTVITDDPAELRAALRAGIASAAANPAPTITDPRPDRSNSLPDPGNRS
jgi:hypothetical protein